MAHCQPDNRKPVHHLPSRWTKSAWVKCPSGSRHVTPSKHVLEEGKGGPEPKNLCTKNGPNQFGLLQNFIGSHYEIWIGGGPGGGGGLLPLRLSAILIHPCLQSPATWEHSLHCAAFHDLLKTVHSTTRNTAPKAEMLKTNRFNDTEIQTCLRCLRMEFGYKLVKQNGPTGASSSTLHVSCNQMEAGAHCSAPATLVTQ